MQYIESAIQRQCVSWYRTTHRDHARLLFAVPNGGQRDVITAAILKAEGATSGVADLIYLSPNGRPLLIEVKTSKGRQSNHQVQWQHDVEAAGYTYVVVRSLDQFITIINKHDNVKSE